MLRSYVRTCVDDLTRVVSILGGHLLMQNVSRLFLSICDLARERDPRSSRSLFLLSCQGQVLVRTNKTFRTSNKPYRVSQFLRKKCEICYFSWFFSVLCQSTDATFVTSGALEKFWTRYLAAQSWWTNFYRGCTSTIGSILFERGRAPMAFSRHQLQERTAELCIAYTSPCALYAQNFERIIMQFRFCPHSVHDSWNYNSPQLACSTCSSVLFPGQHAEQWHHFGFLPRQLVCRWRVGQKAEY